MSVFPFLALFTLIAAVYRWITASKKTNKGKELPGPPGLPIIGNLFDFPRTFSWIKLKDWSHQYGPIYKLNFLGNTLVIVSEERIADDLMTTRGALYSDRGALQMLSLLTRGGDLVGSPLNDFWRKGRKFATTMTGASAISQWEPVLAHEVKRMVCNMVKDTSRYEFWFEALSSAVSIRQNFGISLSTDEEIEHHVNSIMAHAHEIESRAPGSYLVDLIPAMMHLPEALAPFKREASQVYDRSFSYFRGLVEEACLKYEKKIPETPKSFARCWLEKEDRYGLSYTEAVWVMGTLYAAGTGTTSGTMRSFCLAMCHHPEWMQKLNEELDRVVGPDRLPTLQDYGALPNVRAVIKETLRWRPVVAANVPHRVIRDDVYEGYHIPEGALVYGNQWAIHRDPKLYPDGETFNPNRWLDPEYPTFRDDQTKYPNIRRYSSFGFGRRICPGYEIAERSLFMQVASLAWACQISTKVVDGKEVPVPYYDYTDGVQSFPKPFAFEVKPRDPARLEMMRHSWEDDLKSE